MKTQEEHLAALVELVLDAKADKAPEWIQVLPAGNVESLKGDFIVDEESMRLVLSVFARVGRDLVLDFEHQTLGTADRNFQSPDGTAPAAGWVQELEARKDGLWARMSWTERGERMVLAREYRYLSPVVFVRKEDRRAAVLRHVALTNDPAILGMKPIVNKATEPEEGDMDLKDKLIEMLSLKAEASDEELLAGVRDLHAWRTGVTSTLALKADATAADARGAVLALKSPDNTIPMAEFVALKAQVAKRSADDLVELALKDGKVTPANKAWAEEYALKDTEGFQAFLKTAPAVVPTGRQTDDTKPPAAKGKLSEADELICSALDLDEATFLKHQEG
jgi:phage I-like protein